MKKFANGFACLVFGFYVVMAAPAWALGDAPSPVVKEAENATQTDAIKNKDPKCEGITLIGEKFLDMFYAIAMHGDLTDVAFIEKTLQTKFEVSYFNGEVKGLKYKRAKYYKKSLFNGPMWVILEFDVESDPKIQNNFISRIDFDGDIKCLGITKTAFNKKFGWPDRAPDAKIGINAGGTSESITQPLGAIGKGGTELKVGYGYGGAQKEPFIIQPLIIQYRHINSR